MDSAPQSLPCSTNPGSFYAGIVHWESLSAALAGMADVVDETGTEKLLTSKVCTSTRRSRKFSPDVNAVNCGPRVLVVVHHYQF